MPRADTFDLNNAIREILVNDYRQFRFATTTLDSETNSLSVAALNELKNAVDHLARAYETEDEQVAVIQFQRARMHLLRGVIDAKEATITAKLEKLRSLPNDMATGLSPLMARAQELEQRIRSSKIEGRNSPSDYLELLDEMNLVLSEAERLSATSREHFEHSKKTERTANIWRGILWGIFGALAYALLSYVVSAVKF